MRNDLPSMSIGRALAQASHASNAFIHEVTADPRVREWQDQTNQGFGTAIVLSGNRHDIEAALMEARDRNLSGNKVYDPEWKFEVSTEIAELIDHRMLVNSPVEPPPRGGSDNHVILTKKEWACAYIFGEFEQTYWVLGQLPLFS